MTHALLRLVSERRLWASRSLRVWISDECAESFEIVTNYLSRRTAEESKKSAPNFRRDALVLFLIVDIYAEAGAVPLSELDDALPLTSPTLKRTKRRMPMFSPSLTMAWLIISPIVTLSSLVA